LVGDRKKETEVILRSQELGVLRDGDVQKKKFGVLRNAQQGSCKKKHLGGETDGFFFCVWKGMDTKTLPAVVKDVYLNR